MTHDECLSVLELAQLKSSVADPLAENHLRGCARCRALAATLPVGGPPSPLLDLPMPLDREVPAIAHAPTPGELRTGQLWEVSLDGGRLQVMTVIGRLHALAEGWVAAPISPGLEMAGEADVEVKSSPLGYAHLVCVWNSGPITNSLLGRYRGRLERDARAAVAEAHAQLAAEGRALAPAGVPPIRDPSDHRLSWREAERERLAGFYTRAQQACEAAEAARRQRESEAWSEGAFAEGEPLVFAAGPAPAQAPARSFAQLLVTWLLGPRAQAARAAAGDYLAAWEREEFDLRFGQDIPALAALLRVVGAEWETAASALRCSLADADATATGRYLDELAEEWQADQEEPGSDGRSATSSGA